MRIREFAVALALIVLWAAPAASQEPAAPSAEFEAERAAANIDQMRAEKLFSAGERGPRSEPCRLMNSYFLHLVKVAAVAGADTRVADWSELTSHEQDAVKQKLTDVIWARSARLRQAACWAPS